MRNSIRLAGLILLFCVAAGRAQTTQPAVALKVSASGEIAISLGSKTVATGRWYLSSIDWTNSPDKMQVGGVISSTGMQDSPTHAVVTQVYPSAKCVCEMKLDGEDLHLAMHVTNLNPTKPTQRLLFEGLTFAFARNPNATMPSYHWTYLQTHGDEIYHPSMAQPIGAVIAHDDQFGFSVFSESEFDHYTLFNAHWMKDGGVPPQCQLEFYTQKEVPAGQSIDVDCTFRITADLSNEHLLGAYKKIYTKHFPTPLFHADHRPVGQFAGQGKVNISPANPCGFIGGFRRIDVPDGARLYIRTVAPALKSGNAVGIIFWSPGGWVEPMYPPDFDVFPASVQTTIPILVDGFKKYGLRVGLCARCEQGVLRPSPREAYTYDLRADKPADMKLLMDRFQHALDMGFTLFYLDSFGATGINDVEMLKKIRARVGPDVLLYTEYCTDMSLPYADHYCEWRGGYILWTSTDQYASLKFLSPDSTWLCVSRVNQAVPPEFAKWGLTPLVWDQSANRLPASQPVR